MRFRAAFSIFLLLFVCLIQLPNTAAYKSEIEITPEPPLEEQTTKKSGFFSGFKKLFSGSSDTTTTTTTTTPVAILPSVTTPKSVPQHVANPKPPPLFLPNAPLMPLGPRPDTPPSSPLAGNQQQPPQWPQPQNAARTPPQQPQQSQHYPQNANSFGQRPTAAQPNLPPGFGPLPPTRTQPSGFDLSYGGGGAGAGAAARPHNGLHPGLAPLTSSTTTTTTVKPAVIAPQPQPNKPQTDPAMNIDLRGTFATSTTTMRSPQFKEDFPTLPRRPSAGAKEDFPALPVPKTPPNSPTLPANVRPGAATTPFAWSLPPNSTPLPAAAAATPTAPRVAFVPHVPGSTTTVRPGFESATKSFATDDEIRTLTETLYTKEVNNQLDLLQVNPQGKTRSIDSGDEAPKPLLEVNEKALETPTIAKMRLLFNNYEQDTLTNEHVTPNERKEENDFLDAIMATSVMRAAMQFLQNKGLLSPDPKTHRDLVRELWFTQYSRGQGKIGSSGFEHVFVNEVKNGTIIGLHNWVYFYEEEKAGRLDYKGYMQQLDMGTKGKVMKVRFTHNNLNKPVNSLFIGTSPELELALYTVCFQLRPDRTCPVSLGNSKFGIVTYSWRYRGKNLIGSAYPEI